MEFFAEMEEQGSTVAMDVDDVDPLEILGEGVISAENKLADSDFFNSFEDDFDDSDINWNSFPWFHSKQVVSLLIVCLLLLLMKQDDWC